MEFKPGDKVKVTKRLEDEHGKSIYGWIVQMDEFDNTIQEVHCIMGTGAIFSKWYLLKDLPYKFHKKWLTLVESVKEKSRDHCFLCGSRGYMSFISFKCDNKLCPNG